MSFLTAACLFTLVAFQVFAAQHAFTLDQLAKERTNEQLRYERLRAQVAALSSPQSVVAAAPRLGMKRALRTEVVNAPPAAPHAESGGLEANTLSTSWGDTKKHLEPQP
jgi:hypothetical protein